MPNLASATQPLTPSGRAGCRPGRPRDLNSRPRAQRTNSNRLKLVTATIAHEVNQPLSGIMTNASTCLRMLSADPPNLEGARDTVLRTLRDVNRAAEVLGRLRALFVSTPPASESLDLNQLVLDAVALAQPGLVAARVSVTCDLANDLPSLTGDRIQLQQVLLNLIRNAAEAMSGVADRARILTIATARHGVRQEFCVSIKDVGIGFDKEQSDKLFTPFYTTKAHGMGVGLSVSRSIVESHQGRLWATPNRDGPGATFCFAIPRAPIPASRRRDMQTAAFV